MVEILNDLTMYDFRVQLKDNSIFLCFKEKDGSWTFFYDRDYDFRKNDDITEKQKEEILNAIRTYMKENIDEIIS